MQSRPLFALLLLAFAQADDEPTCLGPFFIDGDDAPAYLVSSPANTGGATLTGSSIELHHNSRFYLARECRLAPDAYASWSLVGRRLSFTADLNGAGCACNTAVYLTSLPQNTLPGTCHGDYYCDATSICGVSCAEVDLMEANTKAFHATAHIPTDPGGSGGGIGGTQYGSPIRNTLHQYGEGYHRGIDTRHPYQVSIEFQPDATSGLLSDIVVSLSQLGGGTATTFSMARPGYAPYMHQPLSDGMTLVLAYWSSNDLEWLQGGVCPIGSGNVLACAYAKPTISDLKLEWITAPPSPPPPPLLPTLQHSPLPPSLPPCFR